MHIFSMPHSKGRVVVYTVAFMQRIKRAVKIRVVEL